MMFLVKVGDLSFPFRFFRTSGTKRSRLKIFKLSPHSHNKDKSPTFTSRPNNIYQKYTNYIYFCKYYVKITSPPLKKDLY